MDRQREAVASNFRHPSMSRRAALARMAALTAAGATAAVRYGMRHPGALAAAGYEKVFAGDDGVIYAVTPDGRLIWHQDLDRHGRNGADGERGWAANSGAQIGVGWQEFAQLFSGGEGVIYGVTDDGRLLWFRDDDRQGTNGERGQRGWAANSGAQIGNGWREYRHLFSGGGGIIYGVAADGHLIWHRDDDRNGGNGAAGQNGWAANSGAKIGNSWQEFDHLFSSGDGIIYGVLPGGQLFWYRDEDRAGNNGPRGGWKWAAGSGNQIGSSWQYFRHIFSGGSTAGGRPIIYAIRPDGRVHWYRDDIFNGQNGEHGERGWAANSAAQIAIDW